MRFLFSAFLAATLGSGAQAATLALPFSVVRAPDAAKEIPACRKKAPKPIVQLDLSSIYDQEDDSRSEIDSDQFDKYTQKIDGIRDYAQRVISWANNYTATDGNRLKDGVCALTWLQSWAEGKALTELKSRQAALSMTRIVAGLSVAYVQLKPLAGPAGVDSKAIEDWLAGRAQDFVSIYEGEPARRSNLQNHRYWGGWAVAAVGVATGDRALLDWGIESYRVGVNQIMPNGVLPLELDRKSRARNYHLHAAAPLVMIAEMAEANGFPAYDLNGGAIHRLIDFSLRSVEDPTEIEGLTGKEQVPLAMRNGHLRGDVFAWVEPYFKRFAERAKIYKLDLERPLFSTNLGGRTTTLFDVIN